MLYRISFLTEMLVDADNAFEAERIGYNNLADEVKRNVSEVCEVSLIESFDDLKNDEHKAFPWGSEKCANPMSVGQILEVSMTNKFVHAKKS